MLVDYGFYQSVYGGVMPFALFAAGLPRAEETIRALLYPRVPEDLTPAGRTALQNAICAQLDSGLDKPVDAESAGDFRTQLSDNLVRIGGMPVSPGAIGFLRTAGVLQTWL